MTAFGPYRLVSLLGRGGMGEVWRAVDTTHGDRPVAIKLLGPWLNGDEQFAQRFRRECALAAKVSGPHVIDVRRYGEIDGRLFIEMPLVEGVDLGTLLERGGPLPAHRAVGIVEQVADALDTAHAAGLVHRDVKPSNILVTPRDFAYLIDFGIARAVDGTMLSQSGALVGTYAYMAPERFDGGGDHRADVYALGCVLYETLTGRGPFLAESLPQYMRAHLSAPPPRPTASRPGLPAGLDGVVAQALAKDPDHRFPTAGTLAAAGRAMLPSSPPIAFGSDPPAAPARWIGLVPDPPATPHTAAPARWRRPLVLGLTAILAVVIVAVALATALTGTTPRDPTAVAPRPIEELTLTGHTDEIWALTVGQLEGRPVIVSGGNDRTARVWDLATGTPVGQPLAGHTGFVNGVATADLAGTPVVVSGSADATVRVWDLAAGLPVGSPFVGHEKQIYAVATGDLDGRPIVVSGANDNTARVWALGGGASVGSPLTGHTAAVGAVAVGRLNGRTVIVSGSNDDTLRIWDPVSGTPIGASLTGHTGEVFAVTVGASGDRSVIVSGSGDGTVRVWDLATGAAVGPVLTGHAGAVRAVAVADLGGRLVIVSAGDDATIRTWDLAARVGP